MLSKYRDDQAILFTGFFRQCRMNQIGLISLSHKPRIVIADIVLKYFSGPNILLFMNKWKLRT